jgi:protoporphyrinogen oxidase
MKKTAILIGAGPAGLTAAYELLKRTDITPIILEKSNEIGGISKTTNYKGNRIDLGGHRFFSKSKRVMEWWANIMPLVNSEEESISITYQNKIINIGSNITRNGKPDEDLIMLVRNRLSRIYFLRRFFSYPIQLSIDTIVKLGPIRTVSILLSYLYARILPIRKERSLEDFFINRFGRKLYLLFFKDYTEKVWGVECSKISAEWGAQRIKGINISKAIEHAIKTLSKKTTSKEIAQQNTETSLIERFLYPKYGPGQLWEEVARQILELGGRVEMNFSVDKIYSEFSKDNPNKGCVNEIGAINNITGETKIFTGDYFFSTMPVQELIESMGDIVPIAVKEVAEGLQYRDFITVGVLLTRLLNPGSKDCNQRILPDTWIYIQERDVKVGRLQLFNNWSPFMVKDPDTVWIGMEYFCNVTDSFWSLSDEDIKEKAIDELIKMGLAHKSDVLDSTVLRMEKTYPAYFGTYNEFDKIKDFANQFDNLFLVGRNGMHKYNNSDHSMLTAMVAVDNICEGVIDKENIWSINTEQEYHEEKPVNVKDKDGYSSSDWVSNNSFKRFLQRRRNKIYLRLSVLAIILQFSVFKHYYPQASFINGDSYVYLETAYYNKDINTYPTGYSKFLRILSTFTTSDTVLVACQYLMIQFSCLFLLFTIFYFYRPGRFVEGFLLSFIVLNPLFLYLSNSILSDALFIPLSLTWFTLLIWILQRPNYKIIFWQAIVLFLAFMVRYNALYYPIFGSVALIFTKMNPKLKTIAIIGSIIPILFFIGFTGSKYKQLTGDNEYSPFTGWQMANNAMYAYRFVDSVRLKPTPNKFKELDRMVRTYFDTSGKNIQRNPQEMLMASTVYMWDSHSPLNKYMDKRFRSDSSLSGEFKRWASMAPLYKDYGSWLITHYPIEFARYYIWPNMLKYYTPPVEFLDKYNMGKDSVHEIAKAWFHYNTRKVKTAFSDYNIKTLNFYPILIGTLNGIYLMAVMIYFILWDKERRKRMKVIIFLSGGLWIFNFCFSVIASPIALRFQIYPFFVFTIVTCLVIEKVWKEAFPRRRTILS